MNTAPEFTLKNTSNKDVSLSDFKGDKNVVLLFFPLAFSGVCTKELCSTRDNLKIYNSLDAEVLAISIDSFFTLKAFKEANNLNFSLLSDFNKEVSAKYDSLYDDYFGMKGVSKRSVFVIDKEGRVAHQEILEDSGKIPNLSKVQEVLAGLN
ncbi:MAG: redoxin domain-containing protein [Gracilimonas sp.]|uniref:redoxin domain-containing protein n=1 Tax=Gracilimonas TaxID=649462 RepID=UPI001B1B4BA7|nr:redoxin domain-containing protein [Gracilimonas sp.]MBO6586415.1 redoxin domain-containing protein [Gracilimonas sp.]MBO6615072.1 redoxin domain-containing protein [Gracilimonas sp.]